jgi:adenylate cyclase
MGIEIERKFLLANDEWRHAVTESKHIAQGYLVDVSALRDGTARASVRVRISGEQAWLNIKSVDLGISRAEYELPLPFNDAKTILDTLCDGVLEKTRHHVKVDGWLFEIDEFHGSNAELLVAEIELPSADAIFPRPAWLGPEVSNLERYYNVNLIDHPYANWSDSERAASDAKSVRGEQA